MGKKPILLMEVKCDGCEQTIVIRPSDYRFRLKKSKSGNVYHSRECGQAARGAGV